MRATIKHLLSAAGYDVTTAEDGLAGLDALETTAFDLVCTDVDMPAMDGIAMIEHMRVGRLNADTPALLLTSQPEEETEQARAALGVRAHVSKAVFDSDAFLALVDELVRTTE